MTSAKKNHAAVLFSGGSDSTLAAAQMLDEFERVTLLTFQPGFLLFINNTKVHARKLEQVFGSDRVTHKIIDIRDSVKAVLGSNPMADANEYGFNMTLSLIHI